MKKNKLPQMKRQVAIKQKHVGQGIIYFYANEAIAALAQDFGDVEPWCRADYYQFTVDHRYDVDDVVEWLESFND